MSKRRKRVPLTLELINKVTSLEEQLKKNDEYYISQISRLCNELSNIRKEGRDLYVKVCEIENGK